MVKTFYFSILNLEHNILDIDSCQMKEDYELPVDNRYEFGSVGFHTWSDAQSLCQAKGEGWDLAIIDDYKGK